MIDVFEECRQVAAEIANNEPNARDMLIRLLAKIANHNENPGNKERILQ